MSLSQRGADDAGEMDAREEDHTASAEDVEVEVDATLEVDASAEGDAEADADEDADAAADDSSERNASRLLAALEALSNESGTPLPPSLRGLLGQLQGSSNSESAVAGLFPFIQLLEGTGGHPRFSRMLQMIGSSSSEAQMSGLTELCEHLSLSSEEALMVSGFSADKFLPPVLQLVREPTTTDVLLLAARVLGMLLDLFPSSAVPLAMSEHIVPAICDKLLEIEYMDVAEVAFQILDRLVLKSEGLPQAAQVRRDIVAANGLVALLQFVDFFPLEIQRTAARVVSGLCANIAAESTTELQIAMPMIKTFLLESRDAEILQHGCECFFHLSTSPAIAKSSTLAALVANEEICLIMVQLLENMTNAEASQEHTSGPELSVGSCSSVIQYLASVIAFAETMNLDQVEENAGAFFVRLRCIILPPLIAKLLAKEDLLVDAQLLREVLRIAIAILPSPQQQMIDQDSSFEVFAQDVFPAIIHIYETSTRNDIRADCLGVIYRATLVRRCASDQRANSSMGCLAAFLARILRPISSTSRFATGPQNDTLHLLLMLQIIKGCLQHPNEPQKSEMRSLFERYGVATAVCYLAESRDAPEEAETQPTPVEELAKELVNEYWMGKSTFGIASELEAIVCELDHSLNEPFGTRNGLLHDAFKRLDAQLHKTIGTATLTAHEISSSGFSRILMRLLNDEEGKQAFTDCFLATEKGGLFVDCLVASIHEAIAAEKDAFRVDSPLTNTSSMNSTSAVATSTGSISTDLDQLTQHIKVKVRVEKGGQESADQNEKEDDRTIEEIVILVEPLARIETVEDYVADKMLGSKASGESSSRRLHATHDGDEKENTEDEQQERGLQSERTVRQKCFDVFYDGRVQSSELSVLEAIMKGNHNGTNAGSSTDGVDALKRIWSGSTHEFVFKPRDKDAQHHDDCQCDQDRADDGAEDAGVKPNADLGESKDSVWDLLGILQNLNDLARSLDRPLALESSFLSMQVLRALAQPIRVVTHMLPAWCARIVNEYPFVLDIRTRFHYMFATACGPSRAIQYFCRSLWKKAVMEEPIALHALRHSSSSGSSSGRRRSRDHGTDSRTTPLLALSRMVKLPRLKVRVSRSRLLQSAIKLFSIYGGKMAVIEIEFLGEVGTGLGPTTEFYTLVCQELQAASLLLWRDELAASRATHASKTQIDQAAHEEDDDANDRPERTGLPVRGYHRVAVYYCSQCRRLQVPRCAVHDQLLTHEKKDDRSTSHGELSTSIPQCSHCLDNCDWYSSNIVCRTCTPKAAAASSENVQEVRTALRWWILSDEEAQYLRKVYPKETESLMHPVLQCAHCDTVNFPGTDAGIVVVEDDRMVSPAGRRMHERDYRAVTKHVSPLCEGTPLTQINTLLTRDDVDVLVDCLANSPDVLDSEVDALSYLNETSTAVTIEAVDAPFGLFPKPYLRENLGLSTLQGSMTEDASASGARDVLSCFNFLGRFLAQALLDERLLNLPLSRAFLRAVRGETLADTSSRRGMTQSLGFIEEFDPALAHSLRYLYDIVERYESSDSCDHEALRDQVDAMCLTFTLAGDDAIELEPDGASTTVTLDRLKSYITANVTMLLETTVAAQVDAFHAGFAAIAQCESRQLLQLFTVEELELLLTDKGSIDSMWDRSGKELREHMICAHGYTRASRAIADLIAILCEMNLDEQRLFVRFVTGANRLPLGGLRNLEPKLTVVRKLSGNPSDDDPSSADAVLPSASTCTNYLKLPEYSTRAIMKDRLLYCIREGQCSFHLS